MEEICCCRGENFIARDYGRAAGEMKKKEYVYIYGAIFPGNFSQGAQMKIASFSSPAEEFYFLQKLLISLFII